MKISYDWLKWYVPEVPEPNRLRDIFTYHVCEVESVEKLGNGDHIFDLGILPNRAHDLLSHHGVAKELSGLLGIAYKDPMPMYKIPASTPTKLKIEINSKNCRRYMSRIVRNVKVGPSPEWVVKHLESIGQRSINNIVDATNIVMYDCGQPAHAFDLKKLAGEKIVIRNSKEAEELKVVGRDGIVAKLKDTDLVITDGDKTLALAGIKGGFDSGISDQTTDIVLEIANFDPVTVRKTARRLGLLSDSAKRFENDVSPELCDIGMAELSGLIVEIIPEAVFEDVVDIYPEKQKEKKVEFSQGYVNKLLGAEISEKDIGDILMRYNLEVTKRESEISVSGEPTRGPEISLSRGVKFTVIIPLLRLDLINQEDMAEEIGRIIGYDKLNPQIPKINFAPKLNEQHEKISKARDILVGTGYREVMTYTFSERGDIEVLASASDKKFLRTNLSDGLKKAYELNKLNAPLLGIDEIRIFEIGTIFTKNTEEMHVVWNEKEKIKEIKLDEFFASPESDFSGPRGGSPDHKKLDSGSAQAGQTVSESIFGSAPTQVFKMWSLYPCIVRDIAVWVPEETKSEILSDIYQEFGTELLQGEPKLVDSFTKNEKISYAFRLIFQSFDRTLTDGEVNEIMAKITEKISSSGFEVR